MKLPISVIILTFNEEKNVEACLKSVYEWADEIFIVDSYSSDKTLEIVKKYTDKICQHKFENYSVQRNWAQENLPIKNKWIFHLDADERVTPELEKEILEIFKKEVNYDGLMVSRRTVFLGKWIRYGGHYPAYHMRLFKKNRGHCENRLYDQHFLVEGPSAVLKSDIIDVVASDVKSFKEKHRKWAVLEAAEQLIGDTSEIKGNSSGNEIEKKRYLRGIYNNSPIFIRSFLYFIYRYIFRFGFLDGKEGLIFHFLQGFWYRFLVDAKIYEIEKKAKGSGKDIKTIIKELQNMKV